MKIMNPREEERNKRGATRWEGRGSSQDVVCVLVMTTGGEEMKCVCVFVWGGHICLEKFARLNPQTSFVESTTLSEMSGLNFSFT